MLGTPSGRLLKPLPKRLGSITHHALRRGSHGGPAWSCEGQLLPTLHPWEAEGTIASIAMQSTIASTRTFILHLWAGEGRKLADLSGFWINVVFIKLVPTVEIQGY